jgi:hypothetical protein
MIDPANLPPELTEPPADAYGNYAFQPSSGRVWQKWYGKWLPITEALKRIREGQRP